MTLLLTFTNMLRWMEEHMLTCPFKKYLHIDCPGCGFQRSFMALLHGNFYLSLALYPAMIPVLMMMIFTMLHLKFKFLYGAAVIKYLMLLIAFVIVVFYIYKVIHLKIIS